MKITFYSLMMSIIWGSGLVIVYTVLRRSRYFLNICSLTGIVALYIFCAVRMLIPIELPHAIVLTNELIYNPLYKAMVYELPLGIKLGGVVLLIWLLGTLISFVRLGRKYYHFYQGIRLLIKTDRAILLERVSITPRTSANIYRVYGVDCPFTVGIRKIDIIIPDRKYDEVELKLIKQHELMHIKNGDLLIQLLTNVLCAIYWWNPFVYLFRRDLELYFEMRCDASITSGMTKTEVAEYLDVLLKIYKDSKGREQKNLVGVYEDYKVGGEELMERFGFLSGTFEKKYHPIAGKATAIMAACVMLVASYTVVIQSKFQPPKDDIEGVPGTYSFDMDSSYIVQANDGKYYLHTTEGYAVEISEDDAYGLIKAGFLVKRNQ